MQTRSEACEASKCKQVLLDLFRAVQHRLARAPESSAFRVALRSCHGSALAVNSSQARAALRTGVYRICEEVEGAAASSPLASPSRSSRLSEQLQVPVTNGVIAVCSCICQRPGICLYHLCMIARRPRAARTRASGKQTHIHRRACATRRGAVSMASRGCLFVFEGRWTGRASPRKPRMLSSFLQQHGEVHPSSTTSSCVQMSCGHCCCLYTPLANLRVRIQFTS